MSTKKTARTALHGDMRLTYLHQVGNSTAITIPVKNEIDAVSKLNLVADLMLALEQDRSIPDFSNAIFVEVYEDAEGDNHEGKWCSWGVSDKGSYFEGIQQFVDEETSGDWTLITGSYIHTPKRYDLEVVDGENNLGVILAGYSKEACNNPKVNLHNLVGYRSFTPPVFD